MRADAIALVLGLVILLMLLGMLLASVPEDAEPVGGPAPTVSPFYWHRLDELGPKEDTAHYEIIDPPKSGDN